MSQSAELAEATRRFTQSTHVGSQRSALRVLVRSRATAAAGPTAAAIDDVIWTALGTGTGPQASMCGEAVVQLVAQGLVGHRQALGRLQQAAARGTASHVGVIVRAMARIMALRDADSFENGLPVVHPFVAVVRLNVGANAAMVVHVGVPAVFAAAAVQADDRASADKAVALLLPFLKWAAWDPAPAMRALANDLVGALLAQLATATALSAGPIVDVILDVLVGSRPTHTGTLLTQAAEVLVRVAKAAGHESTARTIRVALLALLRRLAQDQVPCLEVIRAVVLPAEPDQPLRDLVVTQLATPLLLCVDDREQRAILDTLLSRIDVLAVDKTVASHLLRLPLVHLLATASRGSANIVGVAAALLERIEASSSSSQAATMEYTPIAQANSPPHVKQADTVQRLAAAFFATWTHEADLLALLSVMAARVPSASHQDSSLDDVAVVVAAGLFHPSSEHVRLSALGLLVSLAAKRAQCLCSPLVSLFLYRLRFETSPTVVARLLSALPGLASDPVEHMAILRMTDTIAHDEPRLVPLALRVYVLMWRKSRGSGLWAKLNQLLVQLAGQPAHEARLAAAAVVHDLAGSATASTGDDLLKLAQKLLAKEVSEPVRALALDTVARLCRAQLANAFAVYRVVVQPAAVEADGRAAVQIALCHVYAELLAVPLEPVAARPATATATSAAPDPRKAVVAHVTKRLLQHLAAPGSSDLLVSTVLTTLRHVPFKEIADQEALFAATDEPAPECVSVFALLDAFMAQQPYNGATGEAYQALFTAAVTADLRVMPRRLLAFGSGADDALVHNDQEEEEEEEEETKALRVLMASIGAKSKRPLVQTGLLLPQLALARSAAEAKALLDRAVDIGLPTNASAVVIAEALFRVTAAARLVLGQLRPQGVETVQAAVASELARFADKKLSVAKSTSAGVVTAGYVVAQGSLLGSIAACDHANATFDWMVKCVHEMADERSSVFALCLAHLSALLDPNDLARSQQLFGLLATPATPVAWSVAILVAQQHGKTWHRPSLAHECVQALLPLQSSYEPLLALLALGWAPAQDDVASALGTLLAHTTDSEAVPTDKYLALAHVATLAPASATSSATWTAALAQIEAAIPSMPAERREALWVLYRGLLGLGSVRLRDVGSAPQTATVIAPMLVSNKVASTLKSPDADGHFARAAAVTQSLLLSIDKRAATTATTSPNARLLAPARLAESSIVRRLFETLSSTEWQQHKTAVLVSALAGSKADRFPSLDWAPLCRSLFGNGDDAVKIGVVRLACQFMHDVPDLLSFALSLCADPVAVSALSEPVSTLLVGSLLWQAGVKAPASRLADLLLAWTPHPLAHSAAFAVSLGEILQRTSGHQETANVVEAVLLRLVASSAIPSQVPLLLELTKAARSLRPQSSLLDNAKIAGPVGKALLATAMLHNGILSLPKCLQAIDGIRAADEVPSPLLDLFAHACTSLVDDAADWSLARLAVALLGWLLTANGQASVRLLFFSAVATRAVLGDMATDPIASFVKLALTLEDTRGLEGLHPQERAEKSQAAQGWRRVLGLLGPEHSDKTLRATVHSIAHALVDAGLVDYAAPESSSSAAVLLAL